MNENSVWPPPPTEDFSEQFQTLQKPKAPFPWRFFGLAFLIGTAVGAYDAHSTGIAPRIVDYALTVIFCFIQPRFFIIWAFTIVATLYGCHAITILMGGGMPDVEPNQAQALNVWFELFPVSFLGAIAVAARWIFNMIRRR